MSLEAARLVFDEKLDGIGLAAVDLDFLYLVERRFRPLGEDLGPFSAF